MYDKNSVSKIPEFIFYYASRYDKILFKIIRLFVLVQINKKHKLTAFQPNGHET